MLRSLLFFRGTEHRFFFRLFLNESNVRQPAQCFYPPPLTQCLFHFPARSIQPFSPGEKAIADGCSPHKRPLPPLTSPPAPSPPASPTVPRPTVTGPFSLRAPPAGVFLVFSWHPVAPGPFGSWAPFQHERTLFFGHRPFFLARVFFFPVPDPSPTEKGVEGEKISPFPERGHNAPFFFFPHKPTLFFFFSPSPPLFVCFFSFVFVILVFFSSEKSETFFFFTGRGSFVLNTGRFSSQEGGEDGNETPPLLGRMTGRRKAYYFSAVFFYSGGVQSRWPGGARDLLCEPGYRDGFPTQRSSRRGFFPSVSFLGGQKGFLYVT